MNGKNDIAVLSGTFAAGTGAGVLLSMMLAGHFHASYAAAALSFAAFALCLVFSLGGNGLPRGRAMALLALCGLVCALTHAIGQTFASAASNPLAGAAAAMGRLIDSIPYPSPDTGGLVKALTTGDRSGLDPSTVAVFRTSGASHILALSGLHMGIIYMMLSAATRVLGRSPSAMRIRYGIVITVSLAYTLAAGASPSLTRAFLFILLARTAELLQRKADPVHILCGALTIQLILSPSVIKTPGFQLSYLAVAGIVFLYPALSSLYPKEKKADPVRKIWDGAALSISCQAFTGPLAWALFGTFPKYFLLTNLMAMPLTTALMVVSVLTIVLSAIGCCPGFMVLLNDKICSILTWTLQTISGM